jgi:hypothetical protein
MLVYHTSKIRALDVSPRASPSLPDPCFSCKGRGSRKRSYLTVLDVKTTSGLCNPPDGSASGDHTLRVEKKSKLRTAGKRLALFRQSKLISVNIRDRSQLLKFRIRVHNAQESSTGYKEHKRFAEFEILEGRCIPF